MNTAVQHEQALPPQVMQSIRERLISRVTFRAPEGRVHSTSVYSTMDMSIVSGCPQSEARLDHIRDYYKSIGCEILSIEFVNQVGLELGS